MCTVLKIFIESVTVLLLFYALGFFFFLAARSMGFPASHSLHWKTKS